jgi:hypothetical protein
MRKKYFIFFQAMSQHCIDVCDSSTPDHCGDLGSELWEECQRPADACQCGRQTERFQKLFGNLVALDPNCVLQASFMGGKIAASLKS